MDDPTPLVSAPLDASARAETRRARFRESLKGVAGRSTSDDLIRWLLVPASLLVIAGFNFMLFGWMGAARTFRQIEQIPYLISGGLVGLALVFLGGLLLASTFWVIVVKKLQAESEARTRQMLEAFESRMAAQANSASRPARIRRSAS